MMYAFKMHRRPLMSVSYLQSEVDGAGSGPGGLMRGVLFFVVWLAGCAAALAEPCAGNPGALGTSRVLTVSPNDFRRIGSMQYAQSLPLKDHEVVLTFDDGPIPPYSNEILDTLASQCVKATYFLVGEMARAYPSIVRRLYNAGHTIGTHSQKSSVCFSAAADGARPAASRRRNSLSRCSAWRSEGACTLFPNSGSGQNRCRRRLPGLEVAGGLECRCGR